MMDVLPAFDKQGFLAPELMAVLEVGTFIIYMIDSKKCYGRVIDYYHDDTGNKHLKLQRYNADGSSASAATCTDIFPADVTDVAFFFPTIEHRFKGLEDVFEASNVQYPFPCNSPACCVAELYSALVWKGLERVRRTLQKMLTSSSQQQGQFARRRVETYLSTAAFGYLKRHVVGDAGVIDSVGTTYRRYDFEICEGLMCVTKRRAFESQKVMFIGSKGMKSLTKVMGYSTVLGLRRRRPRVDAAPCPLRANDMVHYIIEEEGMVSVTLEYVAKLN